MRQRQVHLDFHTSEAIEGIGEKFSKENFQKALKIGHIDSITVFSKCHHGWAYHPSKANQMHPNLKFDLLKAQIEAAHEIGVKTPVYLSAGFDEKIAREKPEWILRTKEDRCGGTPDFSQAGYHILCMNTPYLDYFTAQVEEVCKNYDADGIFTDIVCVRPCYCKYCRQELENRGLDPYDEDNALMLAEEVYANYTKRVREAIDKYKPGIPVFHNGGHIRQGRRDLAYMDTHLELESLPTGGWGYDHFPLSVHYVQNLGMEYLGMTGKFHKSWGEFGGFKHPNALRYEVALNNACGAATSVGDQLAPDGEMDLVTYELIGKAYEESEAIEKWLHNVTPVADVAVLSYECFLNLMNRDSKVTAPDRGACRILLEGKYLFSYIDTDCDFNKYKVIILPDLIEYNEVIAAKLNDFVANGGKILATGKSGLDKDGKSFMFDFGAKYVGKNPYQPDYFRPSSDIEGLGDTGYLVYSDGEKIELDGGVELAKRENPYFNRAREHFCSHIHTPNSKEYGGPGMTEGKDGIYIAWQIFNEYAVWGSFSSKAIVMHALDRLLGDDKTITTNLQSLGVTTVMKQGESDIVHMLYATPIKRGNDTEVIEDIVPVYNTDFTLKRGVKPNKVYLAPQMTELDFDYKDGKVCVTVPKIENHQIIVVE